MFVGERNQEVSAKRVRLSLRHVVQHVSTVSYRPWRTTLPLPQNSAASDSYDEFDGLSDMCESKSARVHGMLSNEKQHSRLTDGKGHAHSVGFDTMLHQKLQVFREPVVMEDCEVEKNRFSTMLEVLLGRNSSFAKAPSKFAVELSRNEENDVSIGANFQRI